MDVLTFYVTELAQTFSEFFSISWGKNPRLQETNPGKFLCLLRCRTSRQKDRKQQAKNNKDATNVFRSGVFAVHCSLLLLLNQQAEGHEAARR
jgi:hypothetical protein